MTQSIWVESLFFLSFFLTTGLESEFFTTEFDYFIV